VETALLDWQRAIGLIRHGAAKWQIDPTTIGVLAPSAPLLGELVYDVMNSTPASSSTLRTQLATHNATPAEVGLSAHLLASMHPLSVCCAWGPVSTFRGRRKPFDELTDTIFPSLVVVIFT
jgi:hypothetical protein